MSRRRRRRRGRDQPGGGESESPWAETRLIYGVADRLDPRRRLDAVYPKLRDKPLYFASDVLGVPYLTPEQQQILDSLVANRETNVQAGHGVGKTFVAAVGVIWWVYARGGKAITTATRMRQVRELLWGEIRELYQANEHKLPGSCLQTKLHHTEQARAYGFTAGDRAQEGFAGIHEENLLAIQDEASGISREIDKGFRGCITGAGNRGLRIGNPLRQDTPFAKHCRQRGAIKVPVWSHPNVEWAFEYDEELGTYQLKDEVAEALPRDEQGFVQDRGKWPEWVPEDTIPGAVSVEWIEDRRIDEGEESPYWQARVEAEFPESSEWSLVPRSWFREAVQRWREQPELWRKRAQRFGWEHGLDVGDGGDPHALASRRGPVLMALRGVPTKGDKKDIRRAVSLGRQAHQRKPGRIRVDYDGVGTGVYDGLVDFSAPVLLGVDEKGRERWSEDERPADVEPFRFGGGAGNPMRFQNARAEGFMALREAFRRDQVAINADAISQRELQMLQEELAEMEYEEQPNGKIKIEKKEKIREKLGRSPDRADAVMMAMYRGGYMGEIHVMGEEPAGSGEGDQEGDREGGEGFGGWEEDEYQW